MKILSTILFLFFLSFSLNGQSGPGIESLDNKSKRKYKSALNCFNENKYEETASKLQEVLVRHPDFFEGRKKLSQTYIKLDQTQNALDQLLYMDSLSSGKLPPVKTEIARMAETLGDYELAIHHIKSLQESNILRDKHQQRIDKRLKELLFRKEAYENPFPFNSIPLPKEINTDHHEYLPVFNADGSQLIFSRSEIINNKRQTEDLFRSNVDDQSNYEEALPIEELNTPQNEGAHSLSPNGKILVFAARDRRDSYGGFDLYISFNKEGKWGKPRNLGLGINSRFKDTQPCIANNNRTIFFSSHRKGGYGGADIWRIDIKDDNSWSEPTNLGPEINTRGNEESPFLHPDNQTLYFRSNGHIGLGGYDIFMGRQTGKNEWEDIRNLGYPINTKGDEGALFVDLNGINAYYATDATTGNNLDIHSFELPQSLKPAPVSYVKIHVVDAITKENLSANIELVNLISDQKKTILQTDKNGTVLFPVGIGDYALSIEKEGYLFHSENIKVDSSRHALKPYVFNVALNQLPTEESNDMDPIVLNNIFFESGSEVLLEQSAPEINKLFELLQREEEMRIRIIGHTDDIGREEENQILSENRAKAVYNALLLKGISESRMEYLGKGESSPVDDNQTEEGRKRNRRTEFIIID